METRTKHKLFLSFFLVINFLGMSVATGPNSRADGVFTHFTLWLFYLLDPEQRASWGSIKQEASEACWPEALLEQTWLSPRPLLCQIFHLGDRLRLEGGGKRHTATQSSKLSEHEPRARTYQHLAFIMLLSTDIDNTPSSWDMWPHRKWNWKSRTSGTKNSGGRVGRTAF